ncbi:hypothetical protein L1049_010161 [Liquidambar formosana]|uniref:SWIM-type domain-containing protein n=1 Tax=Liquidambar formosana TaxID=63359 RepID=A0AAP0N7Z4_LIQFO
MDEVLDEVSLAAVEMGGVKQPAEIEEVDLVDSSSDSHHSAIGEEDSCCDSDYDPTIYGNVGSGGIEDDEVMEDDYFDEFKEDEHSDEGEGMNDGNFDEAEGMGDGNTGECEEVLRDYAPSDELCSLVDSDIEDEGPKYPEFHEERDMENPQLCLGQIFSSAAIFRAALREHCIKEGRDFRFKKNESTRVTTIFGVRPFIGLDACHLKGHFGGQLLHAIARDGNDRMYPIAMAVVESECKDSWSWFLQNLVDVIGSVEEFGWTFISDRQKGLVPNFDAVLPRADHRFCIRHMYANFKTEFKGKALKDLMWKATSAYTVQEFTQAMETIKKKSEPAYNWLAAVNPTQWARHAFTTRPKKEIKKDVRLCEATYAGGRLFEVTYKSQTLVVDLERRSCLCRLWDIIGVHCCHAIAAIYVDGSTLEDYVDPYFHVETYLRIYKPITVPIPDKQHWIGVDQGAPVMPSPLRRPSGRPKRVKKKGVDEPVNPYRICKHHQSLRCSKCRVYGHNTRICKGQLNPKKKNASSSSGQGNAPNMEGALQTSGGVGIHVGRGIRVGVRRATINGKGKSRGRPKRTDGGISRAGGRGGAVRDVAAGKGGVGRGVAGGRDRAGRGGSAHVGGAVVNGGIAGIGGTVGNGGAVPNVASPSVSSPLARDRGKSPVSILNE